MYCLSLRALAEEYRTLGWFGIAAYLETEEDFPEEEFTTHFPSEFVEDGIMGSPVFEVRDPHEFFNQLLMIYRDRHRLTDGDETLYRLNYSCTEHLARGERATAPRHLH